MSVRLAPSRSHRWSRCPASVRIESAYPEQEPSDAAREGTCAAWVAECVLKGDASTCADLIDRNHVNGWLVTPDMATHVQGYVDMIKARGGAINVEQFVTLSEHISGTLDCSASAIGSVIYIDDLKYGYIPVEVDTTTQVRIYAAAEYARLHRTDISHVQIGIYQPRAFHPDGIYRTLLIPIAEIIEFAYWIIERGNEALKPDALAVPGTYCEFCNGASKCAALAATNYATLALVTDRRHRHMNAQEAATEWLFLDDAFTILKARKKAVEAEIEARYKNEPFPGLIMRDTYGRRKFNVDAATVKAFTGVDGSETVPLSPAEMERRGADPKMVNALASAPFTGRKLQRLTRNQIAKAFNK